MTNQRRTEASSARSLRAQAGHCSALVSSEGVDVSVNLRIAMLCSASNMWISTLAAPLPESNSDTFETTHYGPNVAEFGHRLGQLLNAGEKCR